MTADYPAVLRQLVIAGYEGAGLVAAFERMCAAIGGSLQSMQSAPAKMNKPDISVRVDDSKPIAAPEPFILVAPPDGAKAIARKAFMRAGLKASAMKVGSQLIEHFNIDTGRCDPGLGSLARSVGCAERTVRRAIDDLVRRGLLRSQRHGGRFRSNSYQVNWALMVELAGEGDIAASRTSVSAMPDNAAHQNHLRKPDSPSVTVKGKRRKAEPDRRQRELALLRPMAGGRAQSVAVGEVLRQKLNQQLNEYLKPIGKAEFVEGLTRSMSVDWGPAIAAERQRAGDGLRVLLAAIEMVGPRRRVG